MRQLVDKYLLSIIPSISMTGINSIDCPEESNTKNMSFGIPIGNEDKSIKKFTNYFKKLGRSDVLESYGLD
jgi:hypothetical protein